MQNINKVKDKVMRLCINIPDFINSTLNSDFMLWTSMQLTSDIFIRLLTTTKLEDSLINHYAQYYNNELDSLIEVYPMDKAIGVIRYYENIQSSMLDMCLEEELYEVCHNINRFQEAFQKMTQQL